MTWECFDVRHEDGIAVVTLNRPAQLNSMVPSFWRELPEIVRGIDDEASARAVVLASTGKHFCAGMDLSVFAGGMGIPSDLETGRQREFVRRLVLHLQDVISTVEQVRMPVIAAIQGGCIGGGVDLASACDIRVASEDAFFVIQETNLGMVADVGTLQRMPYNLPDGVVRELAFTGRRLEARRACQLGFVNEVHATHEATLAAAMTMAREIAERSPLTLAGTKEVLNYGRDHGVSDSLRYLAAWQSGMFQPTDVQEAMAARMQKRPGRFGELAKKVTFG